MIYSQKRKVIPLVRQAWFRVDLLKEPSVENGKVCIFYFFGFLLTCEILQSTLTIRVNGATILREDIDEVDDIVNMWAVPRRGKPPATGQIRAITVFTPDDRDFGEADEIEKKRKPLQGN